jgi:hypothetical protein
MEYRLELISTPKSILNLISRQSLNRFEMAEARALARRRVGKSTIRRVGNVRYGSTFQDAPMATAFVILAALISFPLSVSNP